MWQRFDPAPLDVAEYVSCGTLTIPAERTGCINDPIEVPWLVPLFNQGNLLVPASRDREERVRHIIHEVVLRALAGSAPGQLSITAFDPELRGFLSPFAALREAGDELAPPVLSQSEELTELLAELSRDVRRISELYRGRPLTLGEFHREAGQPIEPFQLVVVLDYPRGFDSEALTQLQTLMNMGPRAGISFVVHQRESLAGESAEIEQLVRNASSVLDLDNEQVLGIERFEWCANPPELEHIDRAVKVVTERAKRAAAPRIAFSSVNDMEAIWTGSTADRITATVGRVGREAVELTLGDEREQRHNVLVSGAVGQGKSNLLMVLVHSLALRYSPEELEMYLLDFKDGMTLFPLGPSEQDRTWLPHARVLGLESDREFGVAVLRHLVQEFERRAEVMKPYGDNISRYREAQPDVEMPRVLVVIDEFQTLFEESDELTEDAVRDLERLARKGRAYGIHLVLGSQTLSGITALLSKQDGILAQFPIRVALKNSSSESRVVLDPHNAEAARLRFRGEAVVNLDFGASEANRRVVIAAADPHELQHLRSELWNRRDLGSPAPVIFSKSEPALLSTAITDLHVLRKRAIADPATSRLALLGREVSVSADSVGVSLSNESGRHLAVIGAGESRSSTIDGGDRGGVPNLAVGVLQAAALSLALQHPLGDSHFVLVDALAGETRVRAAMDAFALALQELGGSCQHVSGPEAAAFFRSLPGLLHAPHENAMNRTYVLGFGLDRLPGLKEVDETLVTPLEGLHALLRDGSVRGWHLLAWWANIRTYSDQLGLEASQTIDSILALRLPQADVADLFGPFVSWAPAEARGLLFDRSQMAEPVTIVPFAPLSASALHSLSAEDWSE